MALADKSWKRISGDEVVAAFLNAEHGKRFSFPEPWSNLIANPDLNSRIENHKRRRMLYLCRGWVMIELPTDTEWHQVDHLTEGELDELLVIANNSEIWDRVGNGLRRAAAREPPTPLEANPSDWKRIILWGHNKAGPFTIIEGNHRLIAYVTACYPQPLEIPVFVGTSESCCHWHAPDQARSLCQGLVNRKVDVSSDQDWLWVIYLK
jgi:hypothetical protein